VEPTKTCKTKKPDNNKLKWPDEEIKPKTNKYSPHMHAQLNKLAYGRKTKLQKGCGV